MTLEKMNKMKKNIVISLSILFAGCWLATSCDDMMDVESNRVVFTTDHDLDNANDTVYTMLGILQNLKQVADRYVILGETRGDLLVVNENTETDIRNLAEFNFNGENKYLNVRDYYAIINNCNYYINTVDTTVSRNNQKLMLKEYVAAKAIRAWTYLQLAINYKEVPFFLEPILTVAASSLSNYPMKGLDEIGAVMIPDLLPYLDSDLYPLPSWSGFYQGGNSMDSRLMFMPVSAVLGDWYLWTGQNAAAASCYYLTIMDYERTDATATMRYSDENGRGYSGNFGSIFSSNYSLRGVSETITIVPLEHSTENGSVSGLSDIFRPNVTGKQQLDGSPYWTNLSANQVYTYRDLTNATSTTKYVYGEFGGDLRINAVTSNFTSNGETYSNVITKFSTLATETSESEDASGNTINVTITIEDDGGQSKYYTPYVIFYRSTMLYLRLAESLVAMAQQGYGGAEELAFDILRSGAKEKVYPISYGSDTLMSYNFNIAGFAANTGVHSRGCGQSAYNELDYCLSKAAIANYYEKDTMAVQITHQDTLNFIEDKICDELALEMSFEGNRFTDLVRFAKRRNEPAYLAKRVAGRAIDNQIRNIYSVDYVYDHALYSKLLNENNWYLPLK